MGPEFAEARAEGYQLEGATPGSPYYGYRYKVLTSQGPGRDGWRLRLYHQRQHDRGRRLVAYPAQYGVSGVMSFIVNHDGVVYQKDLGPETVMTRLCDDRFQSGQHLAALPTVEIPVAAAP